MTRPLRGFTRNTLRTASLLACGLGFAAAALADAPLFEVLGYDLYPRDVSDDGQVIVGEPTGLGGLPGWRWESGSLLAMDPAQSHDGSGCRAVSGDGLITAGRSSIIGADHTQAVYWSSPTNPKLLGFLPGATFAYSTVEGASTTGSVLAGASYSDVGYRAFRWEDGVGMVSLGNLGGTQDSFAYDVSGNGDIIVGESGITAFKWELGLGMQPLFPGGGHIFSAANAISRDGKFIVGNSQDIPTLPGGIHQATRWDESGNPELLGLLGHTFSEAFDVSGDGSIVVGAANITDDVFLATIWTEETGMLPLQDYLEFEYGLDFGEWTLRGALSISADGQTITGVADNEDDDQIAFRVYIPEPSTLVLLLMGGAGLVLRRR